MKQNIIYIFLAVGLLFASCTDMNDVSKEFLTPEIRYAGSPDTINVFSGRERLILNFTMSDPSVNLMKIYWNNKTDSLIMDVLMDISPKTFNIEINNLEEKVYSFELITFDEQGNTSIAKTATGRTYGDMYGASLLNTPLKAYINDTVPTTADGRWGSADETCLGMELFYTNLWDEEVFVYVEVPETGLDESNKKISLVNYKEDTYIRYRTIYLPDTTAIDTFYTGFKEVNVRGAAIEYDRDLWTITGTYDGSNSANGENGDGPRTPALLLDGDLNTHWHMDKGPGKYPHSVIVDMHEYLTVAGFYVQHRPGATTPAKTIAFRTSMDNVKWTSVGEFTMEQREEGRQYFDLTLDTECRYFELIVKSDYSNGTSTGLAELGAYRR